MSTGGKTPVDFMRTKISLTSFPLMPTSVLLCILHISQCSPTKCNQAFLKISANQKDKNKFGMQCSARVKDLTLTEINLSLPAGDEAQNRQTSHGNLISNSYFRAIFSRWGICYRFNYQLSILRLVATT